MDDDPRFEPDGYHLRHDSPCVDSGENPLVASDQLDVEGEPRIYPLGGAIDIGADEFVDIDGNGAPDAIDSDGDGLSDPFEQIIIEHYAGDSVECLAHVRPQDDFDGDGFTNGEEYTAGSDATDVLSIPSDAVYVAGGMGDDANDGSWGAPVKSIRRGTTIALSGGLKYVFIHPGTYTGIENRAMDLSDENLVIKGIGARHSTVIDCTGDGGGVFRTSGGNSDVRIENIVIRNHCDDGTTLAPISAYGGVMHVVDCVVENCWNQSEAAAVQVNGATVIMERCTIGPYNSYENHGGGIVDCAGGQLTMESCFVVDNSDCLAAITVQGMVTLEGCTIAGNASPAVWMDSDYCEVHNSILWNDGYDEIAGFVDYCGLTYCCIQGAEWYQGTEIFDEDPDLDATYHLKLFSPCIDVGDYDGGTDTDIDGESRPTVNWIDVGADEMSDADGDRMLDKWEQIILADDNCPFTDIDDVRPIDDYDGDGIDNFREYYGGEGHGPAEPYPPQDFDSDGLCDDYERYYGTDTDTQYSVDTFSAGDQTWVTDLGHDKVIALNIWPNNVEDYDRDGLSNFREICYGTDIHCTDSDGDGVRDGAEADGTGSPSGKSSNPADPSDFGNGDNCTMMELKIGNWFDDDNPLFQPGRFILHVKGCGVEIKHQSPGSLFGTAVCGYALRKDVEYEVLVTCEYPPLEPSWSYQYLAQVNGWPGKDEWGDRWIDGVLIDPGGTLGVSMGYSFLIPDNTPGSASTRAVDLDVDADYDDQISVGDPDDPIELSAGGIVGVDGEREKIIIRQFVSYPWAGKLVLTKNSDKIRVFKEKTGDDEIIFEGPNANNRFSGYPDDLSLWVQGEEASDSSLDVELTLSAALDSGSGPDSDSIAFTIIKVDLDSDLDNDGDIDDDDEPLEEVDLGEVIRVNDTDDIDGDSDGTDEEDDLQYLELKIEPTLTEGKVWFTYNTSKVKLWKNMAMDTAAGDAILDGSYASATWDLGAGDTLPAYVFVEGLNPTAETDTEESRQIILHWGNGTADCTDTLLTTVTKDLGHYAYFAAVPDYIKEKRSPGEPDYDLFEDEVDAPDGPAGTTHNLVAVLTEDTTMVSHDARAAGQTYYAPVKTAFSTAAIIANGAYFETDLSNYGETKGICIEGGAQISNSRAMILGTGTDPDLDYHWRVMGWVGQEALPSTTWHHGEPRVEPTVGGILDSAVGGLAALYPTYSSPGGTPWSIAAIANQVSVFETKGSHLMGWSDTGVLYFLASDDPSAFTPAIDLPAFVTQLVDSGAITVFALDGSASIALLHQNRLGNNLDLYGSAGARHKLPYRLYAPEQVVHYIIIQWKP